ncbi:HK97 gp10 family phage protein [Paenibacillus algorifonticola]|uniref:HK97 gp10 family phage protein n=1 Tax=Paenibacillus algorifonticola TaxID=684063 RepID=UPI003D2B58CB
MGASNRITVNIDGRRNIAQRILGAFFRSWDRRLDDALDEGAVVAAHDVMDTWKRKAVDVAPLDKGHLRRSIKVDTEKDGDNVTGTISASVIETHGARKRDYAAYLHDEYPVKHGDRFRHPTTPGTIPRFIDEPLERYGADWAAQMEDDIKAELRRRGFRIGRR